MNFSPHPPSKAVSRGISVESTFGIPEEMALAKNLIPLVPVLGMEKCSCGFRAGMCSEIKIPTVLSSLVVEPVLFIFTCGRNNLWGGGEEKVGKYVH